MFYESRGKKFYFNDHVCVEMLMGVPDEKRTGRLVQVRKGVGDFCSDIFLIRLRDETLMSFHNVMIRHADDKGFVEAFYISNGVKPPAIPEQPIFEEDSTETEYTLNNGWPETGFIIEKPKQPESDRQSFGMIVTQEK